MLEPADTHGHFRAVEVDVRSQKKIRLPALSQQLRSYEGGGSWSGHAGVAHTKIHYQALTFSVSPGGNRALWSQEWPKRPSVWKSVDLAGRSLREWKWTPPAVGHYLWWASILWLPNSRSWIELVDIEKRPKTGGRLTWIVQWSLDSNHPVKVIRVGRKHLGRILTVLPNGYLLCLIANADHASSVRAHGLDMFAEAKSVQTREVSLDSNLRTIRTFNITFPYRITLGWDVAANQYGRVWWLLDRLQGTSGRQTVVLCTFDADGSHFREIAAAPDWGRKPGRQKLRFLLPFQVKWTPDGRGVSFANACGHGIYVVPDVAAGVTSPPEHRAADLLWTLAVTGTLAAVYTGYRLTRPPCIGAPG